MSPFLFKTLSFLIRVMLSQFNGQNGGFLNLRFEFDSQREYYDNTWGDVEIGRQDGLWYTKIIKYMDLT